MGLKFFQSQPKNSSGVGTLSPECSGFLGLTPRPCGLSVLARHVSAIKVLHFYFVLIFVFLGFFLLHSISHSCISEYAKSTKNKQNINRTRSNHNSVEKVTIWDKINLVTQFLKSIGG